MSTADQEALTNINNSLELLHSLRDDGSCGIDDQEDDDQGVELYLDHHLHLDRREPSCELMSPSEGNETPNEYLRHIQQRLVQMDNAFSDLQNSSVNLPSHNPQPSNSTAIALEPEDENFEVFQQLVNSYSWNKRIQDYSISVHQLLKDNQLKRSGPVSSYIAKRTKKNHPEVHNVQPQSTNNIVNFLTAKFPDTTFIAHRPMGISTVVVMTIGRVMKVIITLRGLLGERAIVKGYSESTTLDNGQIDIWSESKYKVFRQVQSTVQAAMLHYTQPCVPEMSIYTYAAWLHTYKDLFSGECTYCGKILNNNLPPTGRPITTKNGTRFHPQCQSSVAT